MGRMDEGVLELAHEEILRLRERQAQRISSVRGRSAGVLGASGLAASLVSALGDNPWYALAIVSFVLSTIYAVKSMSLRVTTVLHPVGVLGGLVGSDRYDARVRIIKMLRNEYDRAEAGLNHVAHNLSVSMGWFICGVAMLMLVACVAPFVRV